MWWISTSRRRISGTVAFGRTAWSTAPFRPVIDLAHATDDGLVRRRHVVDQLVPTPAGSELDVGDTALDPFQYCGSPASMRSVESALRAMWVSTCPTVHAGSSVGVAGSTAAIERRSVTNRCCDVERLDVAATRCGSITPSLVTRHDRSPDVAGFDHADRDDRTGRMGANMVRRLMDGGHDCVVHDVAEEPIAELEAAGERGAPWKT